MADAKLTALTAIAAVDAEDLFYVVDDPAGAPAEKKATAAQVKTYVGFPQGHIFGLILSNAAVDTTNDINVTAGKARNSTDTTDITLASAIVKQIDAAWAVGTNAGGMNTGAVANGTWYEVHLIRRSDTGVVDVMFTTTANRSRLPTSYDSQRQIGWVRRGTATNLQFTQIDDYFTLAVAVNDAAAITAATTATAITLTVPPSTIALFRACNSGNSSNISVTTVFYGAGVSALTPGTAGGVASLYNAFIDDTTDGNRWARGVGQFAMRVSSSSQITHDSDFAQGTFDISTLGWTDTRGRLM